jgi:cytochrome c oxidase cbb3-type subunit 4
MNADDAMNFAGTWWLLFLVACFAVVLIYALWPKNKKKFDEAARIPLDEDDDDGK